MPGFFDGLLDSVQNPLFLGGVGLMSNGGEGLQRGLLAGNQFTQQKKRSQAAQSGLAAMTGLSEGEREALASDPESAISYIARMAAERNSPNAGLEKRYKLAQINKLEREPAGGELPSNVREYQYYNSLSPNQKQQYLIMKRANPYLDLGTSFNQPNPVDPSAPGRSIPKDVAGAEAQKIIGKNDGEKIVGLPKVGAALQSFEAKNNIVMQDIDAAIELSKGAFTTGLPGALARNIPGSPGFNLNSKLKSIRSAIGFDKLQDMRDNSPTGGALGQVAVQELEMLQSVFGDLDQAQDEKQFQGVLLRLKAERERFGRMKREAYERDVQRFGAANVPNPGSAAPQPPGAVTHRWNPQTNRLEAVGGL